MSGYLGTAGGPRDPATAGGYCLARCLCGTCPQYAEQRRQIDLRREQEYGQRVAQEGARMAQQQHRRAA